MLCKNITGSVLCIPYQRSKDANRPGHGLVFVSTDDNPGLNFILRLLIMQAQH